MEQAEEGGIGAWRDLAGGAVCEEAKTAGERFTHLADIDGGER